MRTLSYQTITGRKLPANKLKTDERKFLLEVHAKYRNSPEWTEFAGWWTSLFGKSGLTRDSVVYRICQDLEARLGIAQGKVALPDYRDYLADLIEEQFGSRYKFCQETGIDPGHLSRVFASRSDLSLQSLAGVLRALHAELVIQPADTLGESVGLEAASRAIASVAG
jgi:hypothetical protein